MDKGVTIAKDSRVVGKGPGMTNNVAEYQALIYALKEIRRLQLEKAIFVIRSDSELRVKQMNRKWGVKAPLLLRLFTLAKNLQVGYIIE